MDEEKDLNLELQCSRIAEITDDSEWSGEGVVSIDEDEIAEITAGDKKPFYVKFTALYEGLSNNQRLYTAEAVKSCVDAMVGVNMYKGHVEPGTAGWKYREPAGRVVSAKLGTIDVDGKKGVLCAEGKAYITEADPKLRSDIKKRMAGNVSILGNARTVRSPGDTVKQVVKIHKPLDSVDFCNPGTAGLPHAGVTAVVAEIAGKEVDLPKTTEKVEETMTKKLTKDELLAEYKQEITAIVGEQIDTQIAEIAQNKRELAEQKEAFKDEKKGLETKVAEMQTQLDTMKKEKEALEAKLKAESDERVQAQLKSFASEYVAEMKKVEGANATLIDLAASSADVQVVDGDLEKSKSNYRDQFKSELEKVTKIAEMFGTPAETTTTQKKTHAGNPKKKGSDVLSRVLSPELAKVRNERIGA